MAIRFDELEKKRGIELMPKIKSELHARLLAQEYVRNGLNLQAAYFTLTGRKPPVGHKGLRYMSRNRVDEFVDELRLQLEHSEIGKEQALEVLWSMINISILDFFDENGKILPIEDLKRLPRTMQRLLSCVKVETTEQPFVIAGKVMKDEAGNPMTIKRQRVHVEMPQKIEAIKQLALIMRWVGASVEVNNTYNIGMMMSQANDRSQRLGQTYEGTAELRPRPDAAALAPPQQDATGQTAGTQQEQ